MRQNPSNPKSPTRAPISAADSGAAGDRIASLLTLSGRGLVIAAVSGGGDSLALLHLLCQAVRGRDDAPSILAVTVDHGIRPQSRAEAASVARHCGKLGVAHRVMSWREAKPETGMPDAARLARYDLLRRAAREAGTDLVLTGHTADDQAETVLMRQERADDGGPGLAGMAPATLFCEDLWIARPLLDRGRRDLRRYLNERRVGWTDDPTNDDQRYERPRLRRRLADDVALRAAALATAAANAAKREETSRAAAGLLRQKLRLLRRGVLVLEDFDECLAERSGQAALAAAVAVTGGRERMLSGQRLRRLVEGLLQERRGLRNAAGSVVARRDRDLFLWRERRGIAPVPVGPEEVIFDGRYAVCLDGGDQQGKWRMGPLGRAGALPEEADAAALQWPEPSAASTAATLFREDAPVWTEAPEASAAPSGILCRRHLAPFASFLPIWELSLANRFRGLYRLPDYAPPPLAMN